MRDELKNRLKIELKGDSYIATWDGRPVIKELIKENEIFRKYSQSRWVRRILQSQGGLVDYDTRILYILDELNWQAKMEPDCLASEESLNAFKQLDFVELGKLYIKELLKGNKASKGNLPFEIKYNLKETKNLNLFEKRSFFKKAKSHENVATLVRRKNLLILNRVQKKKEYSNKHYTKKGINHISFWKRVAAVSAAAFSMLGTMLGVKSSVNFENYKSLNQASYATEAADIVDSKTSISLATESKEKTTITETKTNSWDIPSDQLIEIENKTEDIIKSNQNKNEEKIHKEDEKLKLGSILQGLPEGFEYQEGVDGGNIGKIGSISSPTDGFYVVDYSCKKENNQYDIKQGTDGTEIDGQWGHISLVRASSLKEAREIIKEKKNEDERIEPRGWAKISLLQKCIETEKVR